MNTVANRKVICDELMRIAEHNKNIVVLCSDSRGSASLAPFAERYPEQFVEVGIAEQNLVGIAAGLASCKKLPFVASPASFLSARSYEQIKVDVAYSNTNVKLIGISGGVSYGALGMSHHSLQDIAAIAAIPNTRVYLPSDRFQTAKLIRALAADEKNAYIRVGRNPVEDVYTENHAPFVLDRANVIRSGSDVLLAACGEMVRPSIDAAAILANEGVGATVLDMYCIKPLDRETLLKEASGKKLIVTVEEHCPTGGLGSMIAQVISAEKPMHVINLTLPDSPVITGTSKEVFRYYGLDAEGIAKTVLGKVRA